MGFVTNQRSRLQESGPPPVAAAGIQFNVGRRTVLAGISLTVTRGERLGIIGPNGAGKSTLLAVLAGLLEIDAGQLTWFGAPTINSGRRRNIGFLPDEAALFEELTGFENLALFAHARRSASPQATPDVWLGLSASQLDARAATYSFGMRRKLALARTLLGAPELLLLDEPTIGLDPDARERLANLLAARLDRCAIIMASNDLHFVEQHCDRVIFLHEGRIVLEGSPAALLEPLRGRAVFQVHTREPWRMVSLPATEHSSLDERSIIFHSQRGMMALPALIDALLSAGNQIESITVKPPDLTDVFRQVTGNEWALTQPA
jgi:ABC-2 type transport system ATP-binding protein